VLWPYQVGGDTVRKWLLDTTRLCALAPLPALRACAPQPACARHVVGEGVIFCPRAGCGRSACPVRWARCGDGAKAEPVRHRQTEEAAIDVFDLQPPRHTSTLPNAAVPTTDSTPARCSQRGLTALPYRGASDAAGGGFEGRSWNGLHCRAGDVPKPVDLLARPCGIGPAAARLKVWCQQPVGRAAPRWSRVSR
jgi:hypothetical protein